MTIECSKIQKTHYRVSKNANPHNFSLETPIDLISLLKCPPCENKQLLYKRLYPKDDHRVYKNAKKTNYRVSKNKKRILNANLMVVGNILALFYS